MYQELRGVQRRVRGLWSTTRTQDVCPIATRYIILWTLCFLVASCLLGLTFFCPNKG